MKAQLEFDLVRDVKVSKKTSSGSTTAKGRLGLKMGLLLNRVEDQTTKHMERQRYSVFYLLFSLPGTPGSRILAK